MRMARPVSVQDKFMGLDTAVSENVSKLQKIELEWFFGVTSVQGFSKENLISGSKSCAELSLNE